MRHTIETALSKCWKGCEWSLMDGNDWNSLTWYSKNVPKPSIQDIERAIGELNQEEALKLLRDERDKRLKACDVKSLPDYPHSSNEIRQAWLSYRQNLRDLPSHSSPILNNEYELDELSVIWPTSP